MSTERQASQAKTAEFTEGFLEQAISATKQTERSRAEELIRTLTEEASKGTVRFDKDVTRTINQGITAIDEVVSKQLAAIMHHAEFQQLEGTWRGLHHLVMNSETSAKLKLKVLNCSKRELFKDLDRAVEFDQSQIFKKIYENEFGTPGGEPYGALIGDYEFTNHPEDIDLLQQDVGRRGRGVLPVPRRQPRPSCSASTAGPSCRKPRDLEKIFDSTSNTPSGSSFRDTEDSRFVILTHAPDAGPAALRREHQADRRVRFRGSGAGQGQASRSGAPTTSTAG